MFAGFFRTLKPLLSSGFNLGKKMLTSEAAKKIGTQALEIAKPAVKNIAADLLEGKDMGESLSKEINEAKAKVASKIRGSGRKRKRNQIADDVDDVDDRTLKRIFQGRKKFNLLQ